MPVTRREVLSAIGGLVVGAAAGYALAPAKEIVKGVPKEVPKKVKAGWIYVGPIGDLGWTYEHNAGRLYCEKVFGEKLETVCVENVSEAACASEIDRLVAEGCNVIFTTSFGFMDPTADKAAEYPNVIFEHCSGYRSGAAGNASANMGAYFAEFYQLYYLCGLAAGARA